MSFTAVTPTGPVTPATARRWGWFVALGAALVLIGAFAWFEVVAVTLAGVVFLGAAFIVAGVFQVIHAFVVRGWGGFFLNVVMGLIYVVGGLLMMAEPIQGAVIITLFISVCLAVAGIMRMVLAVKHREMTGWWLMLFGGLITLLIGLLLYATLPWSGLWVVGTLIAVELVIHGITWIQFGLMLRRSHTAALPA